MFMTWKKMMVDRAREVTLLAGGVGGSKLAEGFARLEPPVNLTVIGNTGDDVSRHGLWISPDIDIVTYTLAGVVDRSEGRGFADDTFQSLEALGRLGEETWMNLGDKDLATHLCRTKRRREGARPTLIAQEIARKFGVTATILLPTDDPLQTIIKTPEGPLNFQEFLIRERCEPEILDVRYDGAESAKATPEAVAALRGADLVVIAPSNPIGSAGPVLAVPGLREALQETSAPKVAVSALVGGQSLKGPSDRMLAAKGYTADPVGVADYYHGLLDALIIDDQDAGFEPALREKDLDVFVTNAIMNNLEDKTRLARETCTLFAEPCPGKTSTS